MSNLRHPPPWLFAFVAAIVARTLFLAVVPPRPPHSDDLFYWLTANAIADGHGYTLDGLPTTSWMPGLPILLSLVIRVFGPSLLAARMSLALISACTVPIAFHLTRRWFGVGPARLAAWIFAVFPPFIFFSTSLFTEPVAVFLVATLFLLMAQLRERFSWLRAGVVGLCWGGLAYVKPEFGMWGALLIAGALARQGWVAWRTAFVAVAVGVLMLAPWTYRNFSLFGEFIPLKATSGYLVWWAAQEPPVEDSSTRTANQIGAEAGFVVAGKPGATGKNASRAGVDLIKANPMRYLRRCLTHRLVHLFIGSQTEPLGHTIIGRSFADLRRDSHTLAIGTKVGLLGLQTLLCLLGLWGVLTRRPPVAETLMTAAVAATYVLLIGIPRYSLVLMPLLIPSAAALIVHFVTQRRLHHAR